MAIAITTYAEPPAIVRRESNKVQGVEGRLLENSIRQIFERLQLSAEWKAALSRSREPNEIGNDQLDSLELADLAYGPPKRTYTARVRYRFTGRGTPLPYELDDDLISE